MSLNVDFLIELGVAEASAQSLLKTFNKQDIITIKVLSDLTESDFKELGLSIGHKNCIRKWQKSKLDPPPLVDDLPESKLAVCTKPPAKTPTIGEVMELLKQYGSFADYKKLPDAIYSRSTFNEYKNTFLKLCNDERYSILLGDDTFLACKCSSAAIKKYAHTHLEEQKDKKKKKKRSKSPQSRSVRSRSS
jgi:hypothetical protein